MPIDTTGPAGMGRAGANRGGPGTGYPEGGSGTNAGQPQGETGNSGAVVLEEKPGELPGKNGRRAYSPEFLDKIAKGKAAIASSRSFTEDLEEKI